MPFCEKCARFQEDGDLDAEGRCPACGEVLATKAPVPWHFKFLVVGTAVYLLYRIGQGIDWLVHHVH